MSNITKTGGQMAIRQRLEMAHEWRKLASAPLASQPRPVTPASTSSGTLNSRLQRGMAALSQFGNSPRRGL